MNRERRLAGWLGNKALSLVVCGGVLACGGEGPPPVTMDPGGKPPPVQDWLLCECSGCTLDGVGSADQTVPSCISEECGGGADFTAVCAQVCARWGLESCASTTPAPDGCLKDACATCLDSGCSAGQCFTAANVCQRSCTTDGAEPCSRCELCDGAEQICTLPPEGNACVLPPAARRMASASGALGTSAAEPTTFNYLSHLYGRVSIALDEATSSFSFSHPDVRGASNLQGAKLEVVARACPGPECALRMSNFSSSAADFTAEVDGADDQPVTGIQIFMQQPAGLATLGDGNFLLPRYGMQLIMGYSVAGRHLIDTKNVTDTDGVLDFSSGVFHLSSSFASAGAIITLELNGSVSNYPPKADAGTDASFECTSIAAGEALLNGTGSSDQGPGPGLAHYLWFEGFDRSSGVGTSVATGATASVTLAKGTHVLTLAAQDASGALDLDDVRVDVVDSSAPQAQCAGETRECTGPLTEVTTSCSGTDACDAELALASDAAELYPVGSHTFTCSAVDDDNNIGTAVCEVVVTDTTPPIISVSSNDQLSACHGDPQVFTLPIPSASDLCGESALVGELVAVRGRQLEAPVPVPSDGRLLLPASAFTIRWTAVDDHGNQTSVEQTFMVDVQSSIACCVAGQSVIEGTAGSDVIKPKDDKSYCVLGAGDKDVINTGDGNDALFGDPGDDVLTCGGGQDAVFGGAGSDVIHSKKSGHIEAHGGADNDVIHANSSATSELWGGLGDDTLHGSTGADHVYPGAGRDVVHTGAGSDTVTLFDACEVVSGKDLDGGPGTDTLVIPISLVDLTSRGVVVHGFETIVVDSSHSYLSECF